MSTTHDGTAKSAPSLEIDEVPPKQPPPLPGGDGGTGAESDLSSNPLDLLNGRVGGAVLTVVSFWIVALLLPDGTTTIPPAVFNVVTGILLGVGVVVPVALVLFTRGTKPPDKVEVVGAFSLFLFFFVMAAVWWLASSKVVTFTAQMKVAFGVGGSALGALAIGLLLFRTLRVAASLPVVVLFIGLVAFPGAKDMVGDLGNSLVSWMGVIIGASALAEGATQVTQAVQRGGVSKAVAQSNVASDPTIARDLRNALLPDRNGRPPGDLR